MLKILERRLYNLKQKHLCVVYVSSPPLLMKQTSRHIFDGLILKDITRPIKSNQIKQRSLVTRLCLCSIAGVICDLFTPVNGSDEMKRLTFITGDYSASTKIDGGAESHVVSPRTQICQQTVIGF